MLELIAGSIKQMRLFTIEGIEMDNTDSMSMLRDDDYLYFSYSTLSQNLYFGNVSTCRRTFRLLGVHGVSGLEVKAG